MSVMGTERVDCRPKMVVQSGSGQCDRPGCVFDGPIRKAKRIMGFDQALNRKA